MSKNLDKLVRSDEDDRFCRSVSRKTMTNDATTVYGSWLHLVNPLACSRKRRYSEMDCLFKKLSGEEKDCGNLHFSSRQADGFTKCSHEPKMAPFGSAFIRVSDILSGRLDAFPISRPERKDELRMSWHIIWQE